MACVGPSQPSAAALKALQDAIQSSRGRRDSSSSASTSSTSAPASAPTGLLWRSSGATSAGSGSQISNTTTTRTFTSGAAQNGHGSEAGTDPPATAGPLGRVPGMAHGDRPASATALLAYTQRLSNAECRQLVHVLLPALIKSTSSGPYRAFILDTETTNTRAEFGNIVEICLRDAGASGDTFDTLVKFQLADGYQVKNCQVHNITVDMLDGKPNTAQVFTALLLWLHQRCAAEGGAVPVLIGHNVQFDIRFVKHEAASVGLTAFPPEWRKLCTWSMARQCPELIAAKKDRTLLGRSQQELAAYMDISVDSDAHRAGADVLVCQQVLQHMVELQFGAGVSINDVLNDEAQLHVLQTSGARPLLVELDGTDKASKTKKMKQEEKPSSVKTLMLERLAKRPALKQKTQAAAAAAAASVGDVSPAASERVALMAALSRHTSASAGAQTAPAVPAPPVPGGALVSARGRPGKALAVTAPDVPAAATAAAASAATAPAATADVVAIEASAYADPTDVPLVTRRKAAAATTAAASSSDSLRAAAADIESSGPPSTSSSSSSPDPPSATPSAATSSADFAPRARAGRKKKADLEATPADAAAGASAVAEVMSASGAATAGVSNARAAQQGASGASSGAVGLPGLPRLQDLCAPWHPLGSSVEALGKHCTDKMKLELLEAGFLTPLAVLNHYPKRHIQYWTEIQPVYENQAVQLLATVVSTKSFMASGGLAAVTVHLRVGPGLSDEVKCMTWIHGGAFALRQARGMAATMPTGSQTVLRTVLKPATSGFGWTSDSPQYLPVPPAGTPVPPYVLAPQYAARKPLEPKDFVGGRLLGLIQRTINAVTTTPGIPDPLPPAALAAFAAGCPPDSEAGGTIEGTVGGTTSATGGGTAGATLGWLPALQLGHFPQDLEQLAAANRRLAFQELFFTQMRALEGQARLRAGGASQRQAPCIQVPQAAFATLLKALPFQLTGAQQRAVAEIFGDLNGPDVMYRLLHGDVGSGKTVVALLAMLAAARAGYQAVLLVPTDILAQQHARTLTSLLESLQMTDGSDFAPTMAVLTGSVKGKVRKALDAQVTAGQVQLLVGTHALFNTGGWHSLGLVVIDEQHRFGLSQKESLSRMMGAARSPPHVLSMSATPIPRTMALISYGDMAHSDLRDLPPNRRPVETKVLMDTDESRDFLWHQIRSEIDSGGRAFVVYPLREESTTSDNRSAKEEFEKLQRSSVLGVDRCVLLHGKMKADEKEAALNQFRDGSRPVCVCTTVVEVGVDVVEASVIVVEHADRFGLAQLHQLRGRVGRGSRPSRCFLLAPVQDEEEDGEAPPPLLPAPRRSAGKSKGLPALSSSSSSAAADPKQQLQPPQSQAMRRLLVLEGTSDGYKIAEADLEFRGAGGLFGGGSQSGGMGVTPMCFRELIKDPSLLSAAQSAAKAAIEAGTTPLLRAATTAYAIAAGAEVPYATSDASSGDDDGRAMGLYV